MHIQALLDVLIVLSFVLCGILSFFNIPSVFNFEVGKMVVDLTEEVTFNKKIRFAVKNVFACNTYALQMFYSRLLNKEILQNMHLYTVHTLH